METITGVVDERKVNQVAPSHAQGIVADDAMPQDTTVLDYAYEKTGERVIFYLLENVAEYKRLSELRQKGWKSAAGDKYFKIQRRQADKAASKTVRYLNEMMRNIAQEMQNETNAFSIRSQGTEKPMILDICAAPGAYLEYALEQNPGAGAIGFSLPCAKGGHKLAMRKRQPVKFKLLDITMLAADMGATDADYELHPEHPHAEDFRREAELSVLGRAFDLVLCDGQVLRTHQPHRAGYREGREARRLTLTQLALGLEHLRPGGTMVVLLHKVEAWDTVVLLHTFTRFSSVRLFKPRSGHAKRSSFYMVATDVQAGRAEALGAVARWKEDWRAATFETDDGRWRRVRREVGAEIPDVDAFLREFGPELARMGRPVWEIQADALEKAPFMVRG